MSQSHFHKRMFTLVELIVAMGILSLLMLLLFHFVVAVQRAWSVSQQRTRVYEKSRAVFEVIERDFQTIVVSEEPGRLVNFYAGAPVPTRADESQHCCVVSSQDGHPDAKTRLNEISYKHHIDEDFPTQSHSLWRQQVSDNDSANWNCINPTGTWYKNNVASPELANYEVVARGVQKFEMIFYDKNNTVMARGVPHQTPPNRIIVNITLFDESVPDIGEERFKTQRSFTKIFHLPSLLEQ